MNILFLGGLFMDPVESVIQENSIGPVQYAANKFQWGIINGLIETKLVNLEVISAPFISTYPNGYKKIFIGEYNYPNYKRVNIKSISFNNLWGYRNISRKRNLTKVINEKIGNSEEKIVLLIYSLHTPFILAAVEAKKNNPNLIVCCVVPDLPQYMNIDKEGVNIHKIVKSVDTRILKRNLDVVDCYILLTEEMRTPLNIKNNPYGVLEGIVDIKQNTNVMVSKENNNEFKRIVYTGTLHEKYGVLNLVKAFLQLEDDNVILQICGRGQTEDLIKKYAEKFPNIEYIGEVTNDEAVKLQREADVLVNPRQNNEEFTKYSFPSKNMEYLLSETPTIAYKLFGTPDEYDNYFYYVRDDSLDALSDALREVLSWSSRERADFGKKASEFVLENKNARISALKIINVINKVM